MDLNTRTIEILEFFEGKKYQAYQDSGGVWTIGSGHTKNVKSGMTITEEQRIEFLHQDIAQAQRRIDNIIKSFIPENDHIALLSQAFNLRSFEQLAVQYRTRDIYLRKMLLYVKDKAGTSLKGLLIRRISERLICEGREWREQANRLRTLSVPQINDQITKLFG